MKIPLPLTAVWLSLFLTFTPQLRSQDGALPDAPGFNSAATQQPTPEVRYTKYILPDQPAPRLSVRGKFVFGIRDAASIASGVAWIVNAGFDQLTNGKPHYGTNSGAFAERFGAAALRDTTEDIFSESLLAPLVRQDPRYYVLGKRQHMISRILYAASRTLITRNDDGSRGPNFWLLGGDLAGAALTNAYYPQPDRGVSQTAQIFAGSVGGSALDFIFSEFFSSVYELMHSKSGSQ